MSERTFRLDLGRGDIVDVTVDLGREVTLAEFTNDIRNQEWVQFNDTAIRTSAIQRIILLPINNPDNQPKKELRPGI